MSEILSANLVRVREAAGITRESVAESLGVSVHTYIKWENGQREPSFDQVSHLCSLLSVSCEEFHKPVAVLKRSPGRPAKPAGNPPEPPEGSGTKRGKKA